MTLRNKKAGVSYTSSILGNNISVGLGIASTLKKDNVTWIQVGDGSIEEGAFFESMVFAVAQQLRIIIVVENNNWSLGTSIDERRKEIKLSNLAESIGLEYTKLSIDEGLASMYSKIKESRKRAIQTPQIIECELKTLGGFNDDTRGYVSYHHGPVKEQVK